MCATGSMGGAMGHGFDSEGKMTRLNPGTYFLDILKAGSAGGDPERFKEKYPDHWSFKHEEKYGSKKNNTSPQAVQYGTNQRAPSPTNPQQSLKIEGGPSQAPKAENTYQQPKSQSRDLKGDTELVDRRRTRTGSSNTGSSGLNY